MISARPPNAPTGNPPPMTFPKQLRSGVMPNRSCAPPLARRNPVITSSKIKQRAVCPRDLAEEIPGSPGLGRYSPALPGTGSTMMPAIWPLFAAERCLAANPASLNGKTIVCWVNAAGTPALSGLPNVSAPEPAFTSNESDVAMITAVELDDLVPPVNPRARRMADMVASVPELHIRTFSTLGTQEQIIFASVTSSGFGNAETGAVRRRRLHRGNDLRMAHGQESRAPMSLRSRCIRFRPRPTHARPAARSTKNGCPPTARNARTGEFTPPGMYLSASANSRSDLDLAREITEID